MNKSVGILTIATKEYVSYWKDQASSLSTILGPNSNVRLHVFTDDIDEVMAFGAKLHLDVSSYAIPSYGWPEATLYRYKIFHQNRDSLTDDILMYLDADMLLHKPFTIKDLLENLKFGMCLVQHPGYFRPQGVERLRFYLRHPNTGLSDVSSLLIRGGIGAWENKAKSLAYVPRSRRKEYFCGGIWWGFNEKILEMCENLGQRIADDEVGGVQAIWHDESHLNWWGSRHLTGVESPRFCYSAVYPQLKSVECIVSAVHK
jgi:hypothetical protein